MSTSSAKPRMVTCPGCGTVTEYSLHNPSRPFCSDRCKMLDLGDWASEKFRIADTAPPDRTQGDFSPGDLSQGALLQGSMHEE